jgi:small basic protein
MMLPLENENTSSESSLRMLSALEHLLTDSRALEQISGMKFRHDVFHSSFTIEMMVALSLVSKN